VDIGPIAARLRLIAESVSALREMTKLSFEEFARDRRNLTSAEHEFQISIQAIVEGAW
jgi:hypothetical protein